MRRPASSFYSRFWTLSTIDERTFAFLEEAREFPLKTKTFFRAEAAVHKNVTHGKSAAARRHVPMTKRVYGILRVRWESAGKPDSGWVWPAPNAKAGHVVPNSIYEPHLRAVADSKVRPFVLYDLHHTFLTRLGESGCDAWTLARIAGHSSVAVSQHYVHASDNAVLDAIGRMGTGKRGHKTGHRARRALAIRPKKLQVSTGTVRS